MVARSTREGIAASDDEVAGADLGEAEAHERYRQAIERASGTPPDASHARRCNARDTRYGNPRDRAMARHSVPAMSANARPRLVCLPSRDGDFADRVEDAMATDRAPHSPPELEAALRADYPSVKVRASELEGLRTPVWYVYRDGSFPWSD